MRSGAKTCKSFQAALEEDMITASALVALQLRRGANIGAWLIVLPSTVNGTEMGAQEWRDDLFLCYIIDYSDLPSYCYGCNPASSISQYLDYK